MPDTGNSSTKSHMLFLILWVGIILALGILPLRNFVGHSHWEFIKWIPTMEDLQSPKFLTDTVLDIVGNTALFVPFGYLMSQLLVSSVHSPRVRLWIAAGIGAVLSCGIEWYQVYCHNRFPSLFDVTTNVGGAMIGVRLAHFWKTPINSQVESSLTPIRPGRTPVP